MVKEFTSKLRYMRRSFVVREYTLHFETTRLGLIPCKESARGVMVIVTEYGHGDPSSIPGQD